jgi:hypothetical protein
MDLRTAGSREKWTSAQLILIRAHELFAQEHPSEARPDAIAARDGFRETGKISRPRRGSAPDPAITGHRCVEISYFR